jgi:hypothetical protein
MTELNAKTNKKKGSFAQKRKKRGQKFIPKPMKRPEILDTIPNPDQWEKSESTEEQVQTMKKKEDKVKSQAAALIDTQRRSVEVLTYVKEQVLELNSKEIIESLSSPSGCKEIIDGFLGEELSAEMRKEGFSMFENNKMELDLSVGVCGGEYAVSIQGGEKQYADAPRITEFVVSLTRYMTNVLNEELKKGLLAEDKRVISEGHEFDETASMAGLRTFNRKSRLSSISLLTGKDVNEMSNDDLKSQESRPFKLVTDTKLVEDEVDYRKATVFYYLTPNEWDKTCGGGVTIKTCDGGEELIEAKNDRLVVLSSDKCLHRMEEWLGNSNFENGGSVIVIHFVEKKVEEQ